MRHGKREIFIDDDPDSAEDIKEHETIDFARDLLLPPKQLAVFISKKTFRQKSVVAFAKEIGIAPGIVVGKLQRDRLVGFWSLDTARKIDSNCSQRLKRMNT